MAHLVLPNGHGHGWRPDTPDHRDRYLFQRQLAPKPVPAQFYLDPKYLPAVRDQGQLGSCTGFGTTGALTWGGRHKFKDLDLSPLFAYYQGRVIEASVREDSGCEIRDVVKAAANLGVSREKFCPYNIKRFSVKPSQAAYTSARSHQIKIGYYRTDTVADVLQALLNNMPVVGGYSWFSCFDTPEFERNGVMPIPTAGDKLEGGHCNWVCGFDNERQMLLMQNSYGAGYGANHPMTGERGYIFMPFTYLKEGWADDFWALDHE